jgi:hypothetical protein
MPSRVRPACILRGRHPISASWACRRAGASWHSPAPNYAFKRTAGTGHGVSWCQIGPRPLNASLGVGEPDTLSVGISESVAARFCMHPELAHRRRVHQLSSAPAFRARLPSVCVKSSGAQAGSVPEFGCRAEDASAPSRPPGSVRLATFAAGIQSLLCVHAGRLEFRGTHRHPTMRSSGPRGQTMVFPVVISARGRLTRR